MIIENPDALRNWLTAYLEPLCEAEPTALAKYVMALIKKDKPEKDLKTICLDQLEVFLQKETIAFVDVLFETLTDKTYLKSVAPLLNTQSTPKTLPVIDEIQTVQNVPSKGGESNNTSNTFNTELTLASSAPNSQSSVKNDQQIGHDYRGNRRNRSRSRSPLRSNRVRDDNRRARDVQNRNNPPAAYFPDDRRNRMRNLGGGRGVNRRFGGYQREARDYPPRRPRDLKRGRSRSRSRSWSSATSSRSRSRDPRSRSRSPRSRDPSPQTKRSLPSSRTPSPTNKPKDGEKQKRCRDYDEKGYCMQGDMCPYDHGNDPVVLDGNVTAALGLTTNTAAPPGLLPLPGSQGLPQNAPNSFIPEPYNPEAPGIDNHQPNVRRGPLPIHRMPPPGHLQYWGPMHPIRGPLPPGAPLPPLMPHPGRPRELIGVQTIDNNGNMHGQSGNNRTVLEPGMAMHGPSRRGMHRGINRGSRGGYRNVRRVTEPPERTCLEVRKIPSQMNTISNLNEHFSKFGTIVNLQVCHDGDPEAALVQFASHGEAFAAIRCAEAVLNNRFIKVFWHSKEQQQMHETTNPNTANASQTDQNGSNNNNNANERKSIKDRLGPKVDENTESVTMTAVNAHGSISRTVFDPSKLKKNNQMKAPQSAVPNQSVKRKSKDMGNDKLQQMTEFQSKKQKLLEESLENQKRLADLIGKSKDDKEKQNLMRTFNELMKRTEELREETQKSQEKINKIIADNKSNKLPHTKEEIMAELLNAELDLHNKIHQHDESYLESANRVFNLKKSIKAFGIKNYGSMKGSRSAYRGRGRSRGGYHPRALNSLHKMDRRTRKILIPDIHEDDTTDLLEHLTQFSDVECIEPSNSGAIVTFRTRQDAEKATQQFGTIMFKRDSQLKYHWFDEKLSKSNIKKTVNDDPLIGDDENDPLADSILMEDMEDEEETEDESEARKWKG